MKMWHTGSAMHSFERKVTRRKGSTCDSFCQCVWAGTHFGRRESVTLCAMNNPMQPNVKLTNDSNYRENYANSVQMRVNIWDFFLVFGTLQQQSETNVEIRNFQGIYLSPQQAKALLGLLQQNVSSYEGAFGEIKLDPRMSPTGPVH